MGQGVGGGRLWRERPNTPDLSLNSRWKGATLLYMRLGLRHRAAPSTSPRGCLMGISASL